MQDTLVHVLLPEMGESVSEGSVTSWRKKPGDFVAAGEAIVDVTTDKVDVEVPSPAAGRLTKVLVEEGKTVKVGAPLAEIDTAATPDVEAKNGAKPVAKAGPAPTPKAPESSASGAAPSTAQPAQTRDR